MAIVYKTCGGAEIPAHLCDPCINPEKGGVRGAAYIAVAYLEAARTAAGLIDKAKVETLEWWNTGIESGSIIVIPTTRGTFDGGSPITSPGYGDIKEIVTGKDFTLVVNDPNHAANEPFYAALADAPGAYNIAWITNGELRISDKPVKVDPVARSRERVALRQRRDYGYVVTRQENGTGV